MGHSEVIVRTCEVGNVHSSSLLQWSAGVEIFYDQFKWHKGSMVRNITDIPNGLESKIMQKIILNLKWSTKFRLIYLNNTKWSLNESHKSLVWLMHIMYETFVWGNSSKIYNFFLNCAGLSTFSLMLQMTKLWTLQYVLPSLVTSPQLVIYKKSNYKLFFSELKYL